MLLYFLVNYITSIFSLIEFFDNLCRSLHTTINLITFQWTALTVAAAVVCVLLYLPELFHMMDNNTAASVHASTARSLMFVVMSLYLNTSLAGRTCKDVV